MNHSRFKHFIGFCTLLSVLIAIGSLLVRLLWNAVIPAVTGFATLTYCQALGLFLLGLTLSGGLLVISMAMIHVFHPGHREIRSELHRKWHTMTQEQRRAFLASRGFTIPDKD